MGVRNMHIYAYVQDGEVAEIIQAAFYSEDSPADVQPAWVAGDYIPLERRFTPEFCSACVDITGHDPQPQQQWVYDGVSFSPKPIFFPSPEEVLAAKQAQKDELVRAASMAMAPVLLSLQLGDATDEETVKARAWQAYYRALQSLDITVDNPTWPLPPAQS